MYAQIKAIAKFENLTVWSRLRACDVKARSWRQLGETFANSRNKYED